MEKVMPKKRSNTSGTYRDGETIDPNDISLVSNGRDKTYQEEVYDTINEAEIEAIDKGYEQIKDTCLDSNSLSKPDSTDAEVVQQLNFQNKLSNDIHAKENEYINMLKIDL